MDVMQNIPDLIAELDGLRIERKLSYQDVADACNVSKITIYRALTGKTEPTLQLVQDIAAAVQYKPQQPVITLQGYTQEDYIAYLQQVIQRQAEETDRRIKSLHAHYNMLRRQDRRVRNVWMSLALSLTLTFVALFLYDFAHLDRGWITAHASGVYQTNVYLSVRTLIKKVKEWLA